MTTTGTTRDHSGFAPGAGLACDCTNSDCLGWILCDHTGAVIEQDPSNEDGHTEWCTRCGAPADAFKTWTWCPARTN